MDSISRYYLSVLEEGLWNVMDAETGGLARVELYDQSLLLYRLSREDAESWSRTLNMEQGPYRPRR